MVTIDKFVNYNIEVLKDVSSGSYARTYFIKKDNKFLYRKIATKQSGGVDKLIDQLQFVLKYNKELNFSKIDYYDYTDDYCLFDMITNSNHEKFFDFVKNNNINKSWELLKTQIQLINTFHNNHIVNFNKDNLEKYISDKIFGNVKTIYKNCGEYLAPFLAFDKIKINGTIYNNINHYFGENGIFTYEKLYNIFKNDKCSLIHGDFTIDNIIYNKENQSVYLIDPNTINLHETSFLDFSKLLQSLHGNYEYLCELKDVNTQNEEITYSLANIENYKKLYNPYSSYLQEMFSSDDYKSIYLHEIVHWLRLMPYKLNKNPKTAVLFYAEMIVILNDFENNFKDNI